MDIFQVLCFVLLFCGLCFHILGIYCLTQHKQNKNNQKVILINLSLVEVLLIFACGTSDIYAEYFNVDPFDQPLHENMLRLTVFWLTVVFGLVMVLIIMDRLACVILHIKYSYHVTSKRLIIVEVLIWILSIILAIPFLLPSQSQGNLATYSQLLPGILSYLYLVLAIVVYTIINYEFRKRRRNLGIKNANTKHFLLQKQTFIPFCIILSFLLLLVVPQCIHTWTNNRFKDTSTTIIVETVITVLWYTSFIADPVIYIFLNKKMRNIAAELLCCNQEKATGNTPAVVS